MSRKAYIIAFLRPTRDIEQHDSIILKFSRIGIFSESAKTLSACGEVPFEFPFDFEGDDYEEARSKAEDFIERYAPALKNACDSHNMGEHMVKFYNADDGKDFRPTEFDRCRK